MHPVVNAIAWEAYCRLKVGAAISQLVKDCPWLAFVYDPNGRTLLHVAGALCRPQAFHDLIVDGADPYRLDFVGNPVLFTGSPEFMRRLLPPNLVPHFTATTDV